MKRQLTKQEAFEVMEARAARARFKPWVFLMYFVFTKDEHDPTTTAKRFPTKAMYRIIVRVWQESNVLFIEKSRQIMMTWIMAALFLWDFLFLKSRRGAIESKEQTSSDAVLERQRHIYENLLRIAGPCFDKSGGVPRIKKTGENYGTASTLKLPVSSCDITAVPQGGDVTRSYTYSWIFSDEINHQPEVDEGFAAAMPTIGDGGKWVGQGTANGKQFAYYQMQGYDPDTHKYIGKHKIDSNNVKEKRFVPPDDLSDEEKRYWIEEKILSLSEEEFNSIPLEELVACMPGMRYWVTCKGYTCLRVHYTADPDKDPITEKGKAWYEAERARTPSQAKWEREYEIRYDTFEGRPVISNWARHIFVKNPEYDSDHLIHLSMDFGTDICGCVFAQYVPIPNFNVRQLRIIDEIKLEMSNTPALAEAVKEKLQTEYRRSWYNNRIRAYCDPAGHQSRETTSDKSLNTSIKILESHGIYPETQKFGVPETTELLETVFSLVLPNGEPAVIIHERCEYFIGVFGGGLHYPKKGGRPGYYEKDGVWDHGGDMSRYLVGNCFDQYALAQVSEPSRQPVEFVRRKYTGEIIKRVRVNDRLKARRRGVHHVRS